MKKIVALILGIVMLISLMACVARQETPTTEAQEPDVKGETMPNEASGDDGSAEEANQESIELSVWVPTGSNDVWFQSVVEEFEAAHPLISLNVEVQDYNEYYTILKTALMSGEGPDVTWCAASAIGEYIDAGYAMDITALFDQYGWKEPLGEDVVKQVQNDGKNYYLPVDAPIGGIYYYNKDVFQDLGLDVPGTDDEFVDVCQKLRDAGYIACAAGNKDLYIFQHTFENTLLAELDGEELTTYLLSPMEFDFTCSASVEAMSRLYKYFDEIFAEGANAMSIADTESLMASGKAAIVQKDSYWLAKDRLSSKMPKLGEEIGTFFMPAESAGEKRAYAAGVNATYAIMKDTEHVDAAAELLDFLISDEGQKLGAEAGMAPLSRSVELDDNVGVVMAENVSIRQELTAYAKLGSLTTDFSDSLFRILQDAYAGVYATPEEACEAIEAAK